MFGHKYFGAKYFADNYFGPKEFTGSPGEETRELTKPQIEGLRAIYEVLDPEIELIPEPVFKAVSVKVDKPVLDTQMILAILEATENSLSFTAEISILTPET